MSKLNTIFSISGNAIQKSKFLRNSLLKYKSKNNLRIVYYHMINDGKKPIHYFNNKSIDVKTFKSQLSFLKSKYEIISLTEAFLLAKENESLSNKLVITFDDGFKCNYTVIAPILDELGCKATFYIIGNCMDNRGLMWRNKLVAISNSCDKKSINRAVEKVAKQFDLKLTNYKDIFSWSANEFSMNQKDEICNLLWNETMNFSVEEYLEEEKPYMTIKQIKDLSSCGFEMGSHSMSHPFFSKLTYEEFRQEIIDSKVLLEKITQKQVNSFSYPFGNRAPKEFEEKLQDDILIQSFVGTKNRLNNKHSNVSIWERDNLEFNSNISMFRFALLPILRSF